MNKSEDFLDFYNDPQNNHLILPEQDEKGKHINVFPRWHCSSVSTFVRRDFYRIGLVIGSGIFTYAGQMIEIKKPAIFIGNKVTPYSWSPISKNQKGFVCVFSEHFLRFDDQALQKTFSIFNLDKPPVFYLNKKQLDEFSFIFENMLEELKSEYVYKYSLLQNQLLVLLHKTQKMGDNISAVQLSDAAHRTSFRFFELLEQQFPIESPNMPLSLRTPKEFAQQLSRHVNSLNHSLKQVTGKTSTMIIANRIMNEAKALLLNSTWSIAEVSEALGFEHPAHFTNYFRKYTNQSPKEFRQTESII